MKTGNESSSEELEQLKQHILVLRKKLSEVNNLNEELQKQLANERSKNDRTIHLLNELLRERGRKSEKKEWEKIIDEMAHTINSDVYVAVSYLSRTSQTPEVQLALAHTKQIRDLINLIMFYLKRKEIRFSGKTVSLSVVKVVNEQISIIKNSLSTLRLALEEHERNLKLLDIPVSVTGNTDIVVPFELKEAITVIVKDLLRNAFKNTEETNPEVAVEISGETNAVKVEIINNKAIDEKFSKWFNGESEKEPQISKSMKVGLRVIKKWVEELDIKASLVGDVKSNKTVATIIFPREIRYEPKN